MSDLTPTLLEQITDILDDELDSASWFEIDEAAEKIHDLVIEIFGPPF